MTWLFHDAIFPTLNGRIQDIMSLQSPVELQSRTPNQSFVIAFIILSTDHPRRPLLSRRRHDRPDPAQIKWLRVCVQARVERGPLTHQLTTHESRGNIHVKAAMKICANEQCF